MENKVYDIIIIGAGPAGMTAAIYAGRAGKSVALIDKNGFGGNIVNSPKIENIPGFKEISGSDFATNMYEQVCAISTVDHIINEVALLNYSHGLFKVSLIDSTNICGLSLIFASGSKHKELKLDTKDIYYCVTCDGPLFKNKNVIVVGSGNTGATYALELANYCKSVYICDITKDMCCEKTLQTRILETKNIYWKPNCSIKSVTNGKDGKLSSIKTSANETIKCSAIFSAIGLTPETTYVKQFAKLDSKNYIISTDCTTDVVPGVFVAGDCRTSEVKQVTTACADGSVAAIKACKFIDTIKK